MKNKIDNALAWGNVPDDDLCPCDKCPLWDEDEECIECVYSEIEYERELDEGDRRYDEKRDREL